MCRIAAIIDFNAKVSYDIGSTINNMKDSMQAGGPDDDGIFIEQTENFTLALGHRRLSIIDLSKCGHQPMFSTNKNVSIIYNGEIYNYQEIRNELIKRGNTFSTNSDTEVIIQAYENWGISALNKFIGMFAFLLFDKKEKKIFAVRDRTGIKPLYYYHYNNIILFGSELKSFHCHPEFKKEIDMVALALYFQFTYIPAPYSIFKNTSKVLPGHYLSIDLEKKTISDHTYWNAADVYEQASPVNYSVAEIIQQTESLLTSACNYRLVSDVPVGVFLSGGYDSSLVTALLQKDKTAKIKTYSIGFNEENFNEAPYAKKVAEHLGTDHTEYYCTQKDALEIIPQLTEIYDEPFADVSSIATTLISKIARHSVKVALSADGGDELFGGYKKYSTLINIKNKRQLLPGLLHTPAGKFLGAINPEFLSSTSPLIKKTNKLSKILQANNMAEMLYWFDSSYTPEELRKLINKTVQGVSQRFNVYSNFVCQDEINAMLAKDYITYLPDDILVKVDRATMSVGLEGREPLLDHRLLEWMAKIPGDIKIKNGVKKYILKEIVHKYIPKSIMDRNKMGFGVPLMVWFKNDLKEYFNTYLSRDVLQKHNLLNYEVIEKKKKAYFNGNDRVTSDLWALLIFQMWYERWM